MHRTAADYSIYIPRGTATFLEIFQLRLKEAYRRAKTWRPLIRKRRNLLLLQALLVYAAFQNTIIPPGPAWHHLVFQTFLKTRSCASRSTSNPTESIVYSSLLLSFAPPKSKSFLHYLSNRSPQNKRSHQNDKLHSARQTSN